MKISRLKELREEIKILLCIVSFFGAFAFAIAGFMCNPIGIIDNSVLWWTAQALIASGTFIGLTIPEIKNPLKNNDSNK